MKLIAKNTINLGDGKYAAPGAEFDISDDVAKELIDAGAAEQKTRTVTDDGKDAPAKVEVKKDGPAVTKG